MNCELCNETGGEPFCTHCKKRVGESIQLIQLLKSKNISLKTECSKCETIINYNFQHKCPTCKNPNWTPKPL